MKKVPCLLIGVLAMTALWGSAEVYAQEPSSSRAVTLSHRSVDGSSGQVMRSGVYEMISLVGQPIAGSLTSRSGGIWLLQGKTHALPGSMMLQEVSDVPKEFALEGNYPNPFNPETTISLALPVASPVELVVYDVLGREVARLVDRELEAGHHTVVFDARGLASGIYVYRMVAEGFEQHRTMLVVK